MSLRFVQLLHDSSCVADDEYGSREIMYRYLLHLPGASHYESSSHQGQVINAVTCYSKTHRDGISPCVEQSEITFRDHQQRIDISMISKYSKSRPTLASLIT